MKWLAFIVAVASAVFAAMVAILRGSPGQAGAALREARIRSKADLAEREARLLEAAEGAERRDRDREEAMIAEARAIHEKDKERIDAAIDERYAHLRKDPDDARRRLDHLIDNPRPADRLGNLRVVDDTPPED